MPSASTLFSTLRAQCQDSGFGFSGKGSPLDPLLCWLDDALRALPEDEQRAFISMASEYIDTQLDHRIHVANRVLTLSSAQRTFHPFLDEQHRGLYARYDYGAFTSTAFKALTRRFEEGASLESLSLSEMKLPRTQGLLDALNAHPDPHLRFVHMSIYAGLRSSPHEIPPLLDVLWNVIPDDIMYVSSHDAFYNKQPAEFVHANLMTHLPRFSCLDELAWNQEMTLTQLEQLLDALPSTLKALSFRISPDDREELNPYLEILRDHPTIAQLTRLRIGNLSADHIAQVEALDSIQDLDHHVLKWSSVHRYTGQPVYGQWEDRVKTSHQALARSVVNTSVRRIRFDAKISLNLDVIRHVLLVDDDDACPRIYPNLTHAELFYFANQALGPFMKSGPLAFPRVQILKMGLNDQEPVFSADELVDTPPVWQHLERLSFAYTLGPCSTSLDNLWSRLDGMPVVPALFPALATLQLPMWPDTCRSFFSVFPKIMPNLAHLELLPLAISDEKVMTELFDIIIEFRVWEHVDRLSLYLCKYMPALRANTPTMRYWVEQSLNTELPDNLRRHILRMMYSEQAPKQVMFDLYAPIYGVKLAKSWSRDKIITALLKAHPPAVRDYECI